MKILSHALMQEWAKSIWEYIKIKMRVLLLFIEPGLFNPTELPKLPKITESGSYWLWVEPLIKSNLNLSIAILS